MKRTLIVDITYNLIRTLTLIYLYFGNLVSIESILVLNLVLGLLASTMAVGLLAREMRKNKIEWGFKPGGEIIRKLGRLAGVFLVSALVTANLNNITILWVNAYGTLGDVGLFSIAQGITLTVRMILGAPLVVMGPNLTTEYARGRLDQVERKFREGYRMIVPTYAFAFASIFAFATPILRVIYGADSIAATPFLQLLSFNVIFIVIPGIYTYLYLAADDVRGLFYSSMLQVVVQNVWIVLMAPLVGVIAIASVWMVYIPILFIQDWYARSRHGVGANLRQVGAVIVLGLVFAGSMHLCVQWIESLVEYLPVINLFQAAIVCLAVIPFWFLFISISTHLRLVNETDLKNMESILRIVPPAWWLSRPLILRLQNRARKAGD
jgi:O-antigen/teichoic acid export membrane protein